MKRNHINAINLLSFSMFFLLSCVEENTFDTNQYVISFTPTVDTTVSMLNSPNSDAFSYPVGIMCNTSWTASSSVSWLTVSPQSGMGWGMMTLQATQNTDFSPRTGLVTVVCSGIEKTINVTQTGLERTFTLSTKSLNYLSSSSSKDLKITSNQSWKSSTNVSWISLSKTSGTGDATLSVTAETNTSIDSRRGTIVFSVGDSSYEVSVTQYGADPTFNVSPMSLSFTSESSSTSLSVKSNQSWTASCDVSWLTLSLTSSSSAYL